MKKYLVDVMNHARRFAKAWDYYCVASDAYLAGYQKAREDANNKLNDYYLRNALNGCQDYGYQIKEEVKTLGESDVEVQRIDGDHQLSIRSFNKWAEENVNLSFDEALKTYLLHYNITCIEYNDTNGVISFSGKAEKKEKMIVNINDNS